jgi:hypothetical protein
MLSLLGDAEVAASGGPVAQLAALPYALSVLEQSTVVSRAGVAAMSAGHLHRLPESEMPDSASVIKLHADQRASPPWAADHGEGRTAVDGG